MQVYFILFLESPLVVQSINVCNGPVIALEWINVLFQILCSWTVKFLMELVFFDGCNVQRHLSFTQSGFFIFEFHSIPL